MRRALIAILALLIVAAPMGACSQQNGSPQASSGY